MTTDNMLEHRRYNLLKALQETDPQCQILKDEIAPIEEAHNWEWQHPLLPSLMVGETMVFSGDPFTPGTLKETTAEDFVNRLVESQRQTQPEELIPNLSSVQALTREDFEWGNGIAQELARRQQWSEPVWKDIISGWTTADLQEEQYRTMLKWFSNQDIYSHHAGYIAESLEELTRNGGRPYAARLIDEAEDVALTLWSHLQCDEQMPVMEWHEAALNYYQVGHLARFWLDATAIRAKTTKRAEFSTTCIRGLNQIIEDNSLKGDLGAAILAGQTHFLLQFREQWTEATFQPIFTGGGNREKAAWGGLVEAHNITLQVAQVLGPTFHQKFNELIEQPINEHRTKRLFADAYTQFLCYYATQPREWLKETIQKSSTDTANLIAEAMERRLRETDPEQQRDWWQRWIREYWKDRIMGSPKQISPAEGSHIVKWTPHLIESFAEAIELAKATPWEGPIIQIFTELERSAAVSRFPDLAAEMLTGWSEKWGVSIIWGSAQVVLNKIEEAQPSKQTIEKTSNLKAQIRDCIDSFR